MRFELLDAGNGGEGQGPRFWKRRLAPPDGPSSYVEGGLPNIQRKELVAFKDRHDLDPVVMDGIDDPVASEEDLPDVGSTEFGNDAAGA